MAVCVTIGSFTIAERNMSTVFANNHRIFTVSHLYRKLCVCVSHFVQTLTKGKLESKKHFHFVFAFLYFGLFKPLFLGSGDVLAILHMTILFRRLEGIEHIVIHIPSQISANPYESVVLWPLVLD